jgi:outer membrane usher protein
MTAARRSSKWNLANGVGIAVLALVAPAVLAQTEVDPPLTLKLEEALAPRPRLPQLLPLEVLINGVRAGDWVLLDVNGELHATADAFEEWRVLRPPQSRPAEHRGELWYPLAGVPGYEARFLPASQSVELKFSPNAFAATRLAAPQEERPPLSPPLTAGFFNYDLNYTRQATSGIATVNDVGALTELGVSGGLGVFTNTSVARNLANDPALGAIELTRLETTLTRDFPDSNTTLRLGDSSTRSSAWGRQVFFGGVQIGRNFSLSPAFITQPIPTLSGQSSAPSTVELYINDSLRQTSRVPSGPFTVDNYPLLTGSGQARLVVRDLLGRETVLVQNFFSSSLLLKQGLSDWTAQAGLVRRNLGAESANYGEGFASGLLRYGWSNTLTLETQAEAAHHVQGAGAGVALPVFGSVLGQVAVAASHSEQAGDGALWALGADHLSLRHGFTLKTERASKGYRRVGDNDSLPTYRQQQLASYTYFSEDFGHLGFAYGRVTTFDLGPVDTYSANYSVRVGERSSLTFTVTRVTGIASGTAAGATLLVPLGERVNGSASATRKHGQSSNYLSANKNLGAEAGSGWRALVGRRPHEHYGEAGYYYQGDAGLVTADISEGTQQQAIRLGAQGGVAVMDGSVFLSRKLQDSFALVEVPGYPGVGVGFQSTVLARTDQDGRALVPRLMPYRTNSIRLDPTELPISAELDSIEMTAVPAARGAVRVTFPVRSGRGALLTIRLEDGEPAPAGAQVELLGDKQEFYVARRGEAFITGLQAKNTLRLKWRERTCELQVELPPGDKDEIARVGPLVCAGVPR